MTGHKNNPYLVPLAILTLGVALRIPGIGYSFYGDEGFSVIRDSAQLVTATEDRFRPVFFSLLYLWRQLGFSGEIGLRLLPLLFGVLQIPLAYSIGRRLADTRLACVFSLLVAASPLLIEFSQELRMYSLVALLALLQVWLFLRLQERASWPRWTVFTLVSVLGVYTHLHYWVFLIGFAVAFLRLRRTLPLWKGWSALAATALLYLPNLTNLQMFIERRGGDYLVHLPSALPKLFAALTVGFNYFALPDMDFVRAVGFNLFMENLPLAALTHVPALIILLSLLQLHRRWPLNPNLRLCHELFSLPVAIAFAATAATGQNWLQPKYIIFVTPFALLFIAQSYLALAARWLRALTMLLWIAVVTIALLHFWNPREYGRRENWRGAADYLRHELTEQSALVIIRGTNSLFNYYSPDLRQRAVVLEIPSLPAPTLPYSFLLRTQLADYTNVYYLWYDIAQNSNDRFNILPAALDKIAERQEAVQFNPRLRVLHWRHFREPVR